MDYTLWLQTLMELALAVGGKKDLEVLYNDASKNFMRKLDCTLFAIIGQDQTIECIVPKKGRSRFHKMLDDGALILSNHAYHVTDYEGQCYYVYTLAEHGWLVMVRGQRMPLALEKELVPIVDMLGANINGCKAFSLQNQTEQTLKTERALIQRRMQFQQTLMTLSLAFINIEVENIGRGINEALSSAGSFVDVDRAYVFEYDFEAQWMNNTHEWCKDGVSPSIDILQQVPMAPFMQGWVQPHTNGEMVLVSDVDALQKGDPLYEILSMQDIKSLVTIPLKHKKQTLGFIGFDAVEKKKTFNEDELSLLLLLAEMFTNALLRKAHEAELVEARLAAVEASRAKSRFLANMSHEIRTPLNGIVGMMYLLKDTSLSQTQVEYIKIVDNSIDALMSIINNILDFSKIEAGQMMLNLEAFDLEEEIYKVCGMVSGKASEKGLEIIVDYAENCPIGFNGDCSRIRQILINLMGNAVKFTENGHILVKVTPLELGISLTVEDTGIGISPKAQNEIFEQFTQEDDSTSKRYGGTGLGLAITKQLVELMNGDISVSSVLGEGSIFALKLPLKSVDLEPDVELDKETLKEKRVLVVDDHPVNRKILKSYLDTWGLDNDWAEDGVNAILAIEKSYKEQRLYDFALIDLVMPQMDGTTLCKIIKSRKEWESIQLILLSSVVGSVHENEYRECGFKAIMPKPFTRNELLKNMINFTQPSSETSLVPSKEGLRVLIVDDNEVNRIAVSHILRKHGYQVLAAHGGEMALDIVQHTPLDLILMDIQMPGMDGYETTRIIRSLSGPESSVPIVAISANALSHNRQESLDAGMNGHIAKPFKLEDLLDAYNRYGRQDYSKELPNFLTVDDDTFDHTAFIKHFAGHFDLATEILSIYRSDFESYIQRLEASILNGECANVRSIAHELKGASAYVYAGHISFLCEEISKSCEEKRLDTLMRLLETIKEKGEVFIQQSAQWLNNRGDQS